MSSTELNPKPLRVSPVIKFARWSLLLLGIGYGAFHYRRFSRREAALREIEERERPMREAKQAEERRRIQEAEMRALEEIFNPKK